MTDEPVPFERCTFMTPYGMAGQTMRCQREVGHMENMQGLHFSYIPGSTEALEWERTHSWY